MTLQHVNIVFQVIVFLFAISIHESAHAFTAWRCGDPTAKMLGRVSLNPIRHIDLFGTVILPAMALLTHLPVIGWAKPTPVDPRNFSKPMRDDILTSVAGPVSNFLAASVAVIGMAIIALVSPIEGRVLVHGLAGYGYVGGSTSVLVPVTLLLYWGMVINVLLGVFNLIPVPPLDGSHVLRHVLPESLRNIYDRLGLIGLFVLVLFGGRLLTGMMSPFLDLFNSLLLRI